jgi:hypothetical protein
MREVKIVSLAETSKNGEFYTVIVRLNPENYTLVFIIYHDL